MVTLLRKPQDFVYNENGHWADIFNYLKLKGFDVYSPEILQGECTKPFIVVRNNGLIEIPGTSSNDWLYQLVIYVPQKQYSLLEPYVKSVMKAMRELEPLIMPVNNISSSVYDDAVKGHQVTIDYKNHIFTGGYEK